MTKQTEAMKLALEALLAATPVKAKDPQVQADAIVALREALAERPAQQEPVAVKGWRLVPTEPTMEMLAAMGFDGDYDLAIGHAAICEALSKTYRDLIAAAPPAPAQEPDPDKLTIAYMSGLHEGKKAERKRIVNLLISRYA